MIKNYYQTLGLEQHATTEEIKKAYRTYASKFHPDKQNNDNFFEERFKEINEAYVILSDPKKRVHYDFTLNSSINVESKNENHHNKRKQYSSANDIINDLINKQKSKDELEQKKRQTIYYTSKQLLLNGLYINCNGRNYELDNYDASTLKKDDSTNYILTGSAMIIIGVFTITFFIGFMLLMIGIYLLFYREYIIVLVGKKGDVPLIKGKKSKMKHISKLINLAIQKNYK